jgi:hypothetical protein
LASDGGSWCIYAEKASDLAVIALRDVGASTQFQFALSYFGADTLTYLLRSQYSFTGLTAHWRAGPRDRASDVQPLEEPYGTVIVQNLDEWITVVSEYFQLRGQDLKLQRPYVVIARLDCLLWD